MAHSAKLTFPIIEDGLGNVKQYFFTQTGGFPEKAARTRISSQFFGTMRVISFSGPANPRL